MAGAADINVKIALDGEKGYREALKNCNAALKSAQAALKVFDEEAKGSANTLKTLEEREKKLNDVLTAAKEKQDAMNSALGEAQKKRDEALKTLEEAKQKYGEESKEVEKAEKAYASAENAVDRYQTEVYKATSEVNKINTEITDNSKYLDEAKDSTDGCATSIDEYGKEVKDSTDETSDFQKVVGKTAAMEAMTKIAEKLSGAFKKVNTAVADAAKEVETGLKQINKKTGASGETLEKYKRIARDTFTSLPVSIETASEAVGELATRFSDLNDEELAELTTSFVKFAELNDTDVSTAIDTTQKALAAFGMSAEDAETVLDVFNKTGQNTGVNAASLAATITSNAEAFQQMGMDIYQASDFLGQLEMSGADSSAVLMGLKTALKKATDEGTPFNEALAEMQDSIVNGTEDMDGLSYAFEVFGTRSGAQVFNAVKNGTIDFQNLAESTDIVNTAQNNLNDTYDNSLTVYDKYEIAQNNINDAAAELGKEFNKALTPAIEGVTGVLQDATEKFKELPDNVKTAISIIATLGGKVLEVAPQIASLVAQIAALKVAKKAAGDTTSLKTSFGSLASKAGLLTGVLAAISAGVAFMAGEMEKATTSARDLHNEVVGLKEGYEDTREEISNVNDVLSSNMSTEEKVAEVKRLLTEAQNANAEATAESAKATDELNNVENVEVGLAAQLMGGMAGLNANFYAQAQAAAYAGSSLQDSNAVMEDSSEDVQYLESVLADLEAQLYADGKAGGQMSEDIAAGINSGAPDVYAAAMNVARQAQAGVNSTDVYGNGYNIGANLCMGIVKGIQWKQNDAINAAASTAHAIVNKTRSIMAISSPSKVYEEIGKYMDLGLAEGIAKYSRVPEAAITDMSNGLIQTPDLSRYGTSSAINNQVAVYIGDKELTAIMAAGVVKNISTNQRARYAAAGG